ncbi:MAG: DNA repair protein RadC [Hyphomicrobiaceae bacterium]
MTQSSFAFQGVAFTGIDRNVAAGVDKAEGTASSNRNCADDVVPARRTRRAAANGGSANTDPGAVAGPAGHRERVRERVLAGASTTMHDYELLEFLLFGVVRQGDTKGVAKLLLARFGTLADVLAAEPERLREVKGVGDATVALFAVVRETSLRQLRAEVRGQPILGSWQKVLDYCHVAMGRGAREQFRILFLDKKNRLIADEVQQEGTVDHTPVYVREVCKRALELSATAVILVHNHPSGDPTPSQPDVDMTNQIIAALRPLGITIHDHIIVAREGHVSFRSRGLIR